MNAEELKAAVKEYRKLYYREHKESIRASQRRYAARNKDKLYAYTKEYRKAHPEKVKEWRERAASRAKEKKAQEGKAL